MADKSQELALALLKEAKEKGTLDPSIEKGLAELIGKEERPRVKEVLKTPVAAEEEKRQLFPEQVADLFTTLESRLSKKPEHYKRHKDVNFAEVKKALEANPACMYSLAQMESTGGMPDIITVEEDVFVFADCSAESPDRRDLNYDQAAEMAKKFGVDMMSEEAYREMQKTGKFDVNTWSWLATPNDIRESGYAWRGRRGAGGVDVRQYGADYHRPNFGWRGLLRVQKA